MTKSLFLSFFPSVSRQSVNLCFSLYTLHTSLPRLPRGPPLQVPWQKQLFCSSQALLSGLSLQRAAAVIVQPLCSAGRMLNPATALVPFPVPQTLLCPFHGISSFLTLMVTCCLFILLFPVSDLQGPYGTSTACIWISSHSCIPTDTSIKFQRPQEFPPPTCVCFT